LIAGFTGAIGRQLTPRLEPEGHDVVGFSAHGRRARPRAARPGALGRTRRAR